jgi:hypothetical protein
MMKRSPTYCVIDCFTSLDDLPKKYWSDDMRVLRAISVARRVSTFEMTRELWSTLERLERSGYITLPKTAYPWFSTPLTDSGRARLASPSGAMP